MKIHAEVNIPSGQTCLHSDGQLCCLFNPGINGHPTCWGWNNLPIIDLKKTVECLTYGVESYRPRGFLDKYYSKSHGQ